MPEREWLVAAVAAFLGLVTIWAGISDNAFAFKLWLPRLLEGNLGRGKARAALALLGLGLVLMGVFLALRVR